MMNKKYYIPLAICLSVFVLFAAMYFYDGNQDENELTLYGNIDIRQVQLGFRVFGKLNAMHYEEGDALKGGELMAELDPEPYETALKEAAWRVKSLQNNLLLAEAQLKRRDALVQGKSVSEEDFERALYNEKALKANLEEAEAAYERADIQLRDTKLVCPAAGTIFTRVREPGTVLSPGEPAYILSVTSPVWARTYVSEVNLGKVYPGMRAEVMTDTPNSPVYKGQIGFISPTAEFTPKNVETPDLRTSLVYQLRVVIEHPDEGLRQGMPVTVKIQLNKEKNE